MHHHVLINWIRFLHDCNTIFIWTSPDSIFDLYWHFLQKKYDEVLKTVLPTCCLNLICCAIWFHGKICEIEFPNYALESWFQGKILKIKFTQLFLKLISQKLREIEFCYVLLSNLFSRKNSWNWVMPRNSSWIWFHRKIREIEVFYFFQSCFLGKIIEIK